ncbi:hypothetical protein [Treponema sp.]|uniref:hypothetical protein n=1 Tax=Treponema sp. TaxID=166 RepID=UPI0025F2A5C2|nr:hypothetical protein [Treponema sp.]MCR5217948.1 hypothetical protein [Treponema sp.]
MKRFLIMIAAAAVLPLFFSCKNEIIITADNSGGYTIDACSLNLGNALKETIQQITDYSGQDIEESFFSEKEIARTCTDKNFTDRFISCTSYSLVVKVSPEILQQTYFSLTDEEKNYMDLLMAPSLTGEVMLPEEYRDLVASVYGEELAEEMWDAKVILNVGCPAGKKIKKALSSRHEISHSEKRASFEIPLVYLLSMQSTAEYSIYW